VSGTHAHALHYHGHSPIHRAAPQVKLLALFGFVVSVVATPPLTFWAFSAHILILLAVLAISGVPSRFFLSRLAIDIPFVLFALVLPFVGADPRADVGPFSVSIAGLVGAWNLLAKATLGAGASVLLAATTEVPDLLKGLERLRVPRVLVAIAAFMIRYLEVIAGELRRTRTAMTARGYDPSWLAQARPLAASAGALFVRSYERGERVHQAMLARGYQGEMPAGSRRKVTARDWLGGLVPAVAAALVMGLARLGL
jgi:cobalt/nickel transport system permease protein